MSRDKLFTELKESAVNKVPVSHDKIRYDLEELGFRVEYKYTHYTELGNGYPEIGHFTQWLYYRNRKYGAIVYTAVINDDGINVYVTQCFCNVCPRYEFTINNAPAYGTEVLFSHNRINRVDRIYIAPKPGALEYYLYYKVVVDIFKYDDSKNSMEYTYVKDDCTYREVYTKLNDNTYHVERINLNHLDVEYETKFYVV